MHAPGGALYVLAHQDDEYGCIAQIRADAEAGRRVGVVYLTDGTSNVGEAVRTAESRAVLASLGVPDDDVAVLGAPLGIVCLQLPQRLDDAYRALRAFVAERGFTRPDHITTCAWEGGNPDHDAAHLAAAKLARELGCARIREVALYNAYRRPGPFFRVMSFCDGARVGPEAGPRLTFAGALRDALTCWRYPSQRTTWIGLFPGAVVRLMLRRRHAVREVSAARPLGRPHRGALYYERRWRVPYATVAELTATFYARDAVEGSAPPG
jgi:LmbE family N-acetylglucosaminyl deacetylase